jgi:hypothetical protein
MSLNKERTNAALAMLMLLFFALGCAQLKNLGGGGAEVNKLIDSANKDLEDIQKISDDNRSKPGEISEKADNNDIDGAKKEIGDSIKAIDQGLDKGKSASDKFDKASKAVEDPKVKEYLSLKAQAVQKSVDAFEELRKGLMVLQDNIGSSNKAAIQRAQKDVQRYSDNFTNLRSEADKLERKATDIARENPEKFKG